MRCLTRPGVLVCPLTPGPTMRSFGVILFEFLCRQVPFKAQPAHSIPYLVLKGVRPTTYAPLKDVDPNLQALEALMHECWSVRAVRHAACCAPMHPARTHLPLCCMLSPSPLVVHRLRLCCSAWRPSARSKSRCRRVRLRTMWCFPAPATRSKRLRLPPPCPVPASPST